MVKVAAAVWASKHTVFIKLVRHKCHRFGIAKTGTDVWVARRRGSWWTAGRIGVLLVRLVFWYGLLPYLVLSSEEIALLVPW